MNAPLALGGRHALHTVHPTLVLEHAERAVALDRERGLLHATSVGLAHVEQFHLVPTCNGVALVDIEQVAREQRGLLAAGAAADLHDHVAGVVGVGFNHGRPDERLEHVHLCLSLFEKRPEVVVLALGQHFAGLRGAPGSIAPPHGQLCGVFESGIPAIEVGVARAVGRHLRVREGLRQLRTRALYLGHQARDSTAHVSTHRGAGASCAPAATKAVPAGACG